MSNNLIGTVKRKTAETIDNCFPGRVQDSSIDSILTDGRSLDLPNIQINKKIWQPARTAKSSRMDLSKEDTHDSTYNVVNISSYYGHSFMQQNIKRRSKGHSVESERDKITVELSVIPGYVRPKDNEHNKVKRREAEEQKRMKLRNNKMVKEKLDRFMSHQVSPAAGFTKRMTSKQAYQLIQSEMKEELVKQRHSDFKWQKKINKETKKNID
jgi:hypothetical protein